jgi:hypothetical protein
MVDETFSLLDITCLIHLGVLMNDESHLLRLARRCLDLEKIAIEPEVIEQLRIWATELAEDLECRAVQHEMAESSVSD